MDEASWSRVYTHIARKLPWGRAFVFSFVFFCSVGSRWLALYEDRRGTVGLWWFVRASRAWEEDGGRGRISVPRSGSTFVFVRCKSVGVVLGSNRPGIHRVRWVPAPNIVLDAAQRGRHLRFRGASWKLRNAAVVPVVCRLSCTHRFGCVRRRHSRKS